MRVHPGMPRRVGRVLGDRLHPWRGHAAIVGQFGDVAEAPTKKFGAHLRSLTTALGASVVECCAMSGRSPRRRLRSASTASARQRARRAAAVVEIELLLGPSSGPAQ
jgi:hypothetical protein